MWNKLCIIWTTYCYTQLLNRKQSPAKCLNPQLFMHSCVHWFTQHNIWSGDTATSATSSVGGTLLTQSIRSYVGGTLFAQSIRSYVGRTLLAQSIRSYAGGILFAQSIRSYARGVLFAATTSGRYSRGVVHSNVMQRTLCKQQNRLREKLFMQQQELRQQCANSVLLRHVCVLCVRIHCLVVAIYIYRECMPCRSTCYIDIHRYVCYHESVWRWGGYCTETRHKSSTPQNLEDPCHLPNSSDLVPDNLLPSSNIFGVVHCTKRGRGRGGCSAQVSAHTTLCISHSPLTQHQTP